MENNNIYFHKGFYIDKTNDIETCLRSIENTHFINDEDCPYEDAHIFLQGACHVFALVLNENFGFKTYEMTSENKKSLHWFCQSIYKGKKVYIDVRGATTNFQEFYDGLIYFRGLKHTIKQKNIKKEKFNEEYFDVGITFAQNIIRQYYNYYIIN